MRTVRLIPLLLAAGLTLAVALGSPNAGAKTSSPARMLITEQEWRVQLSRGQAPSGALTVQVINRGQDPHTIAVKPAAGTHARLPGTELRSSGLISPGSLHTVSFRLPPGRYEFYCTLRGHEHLGMRAFLTVTR